MTPVFTRSLTIWIAVVAISAFVAAGTMAASLSETPPLGSITDPKNRHNMSSNATHVGGVKALAPSAGGTDQICIFCHTPHGASLDGPLWNRNAPTGPFSLYSGALAIKGNLPGGGPGQDGTAPNTTKYKTTDSDPNFVYPNGASRLCMSCHDGVTAINVLRNGDTIAMVTNANRLDPDASLKGQIGGSGLQAPIDTIIDLSTTHPISFVYTDSIVATIINPAYSSANLSDRYDGPGSFVAGVDTPLDSQSRMQCTTCHDPHLDKSLVPAYSSLALPPFWRQTVAVGPDSPYNAVCNNCHQTAASPSSPVHPPVNPPLP